MARALANECSQGDTKVAFFMRKGADCLSKWVGESERQLRLLFDQVSHLSAYHPAAPSISHCYYHCHVNMLDRDVVEW